MKRQASNISVPGNESSALIGSLSPSQSYQVFVGATTSAGDGQYSSDPVIVPSKLTYTLICVSIKHYIYTSNNNSDSKCNFNCYLFCPFETKYSMLCMVRNSCTHLCICKTDEILHVYCYLKFCSTRIPFVSVKRWRFYTLH